MNEQRRVVPATFLVGETKLCPPDQLPSSIDSLYDYLELIGVPGYSYHQCPSQLEDILMVGGKLCYRSFKVGLNKNVTQIREDPLEYLTNINKVGHGSVLEHGNVSFIFHNVSRVFTHELVRHRVGIAFSQESLRYVRLTELEGFLPTCLDDDWGRHWHQEKMELMSQWQAELARHYQIDSMSDFTRKKELTSAFRRYAPIGLATSILCSMNIRTLRHNIQMRTDSSAEEEIRFVFHQVAQICVSQYPYIFGDFYHDKVVNSIPVWRSRFASTPYDQQKMAELQKENNRLKERIKVLEFDLSLIDWGKVK